MVIGIPTTSGLGKHPAARGEAGFGHISQKLKVKGNQQKLQVFASLSMTKFCIQISRQQDSLDGTFCVYMCILMYTYADMFSNIHNTDGRNIWPNYIGMFCR